MSFQADNLPDIPSQTVTEEKYTDEHGNMVVKKVRGVSKINTKSKKVTVFTLGFCRFLSHLPDHTEGDS